MPATRILYLGESDPGSTSGHRIAALRRLGYSPKVVSAAAILPRLNRVWWKLHRWTGYYFLQSSIAQRLRAVIGEESFDLAWVDSGWWCGRPVARTIKSVAAQLMLYNLDDPSGPREPYHWKSLVKALPIFDFAAVVRAETQAEFEALGCNRVLRMWRCYDEIAHHPDQEEKVPNGKFESEVCFIGTWMEDRHRFILQLMEAGVPISVWGNGWQRSPAWNRIRACHRGPGIHNEEYVAAIRRAKICVGTLSRLNRDLHTTRSSEIPYAGGVLSMPRTREHEQMFPEPGQALLWSDPEQCAQQCLAILRDPGSLEQMRKAGMNRIRALQLGNEDCLRALLNFAAVGHYEPHTPLLRSGNS